MNPVITTDQAKQITGGRTPLVPVEYEQACRSLAACTSIDEAKYWDNKADALAAWAKIYKSDQAALEAKRLKLHAYRRMGELAAEIRPTKHVAFGSGAKGFRGSEPGQNALLRGQGFTREQARHIQAIAKVDSEKFELAVALPRPPAPSTFARTAAASNPEYAAFNHLFRMLLCHCRKTDAPSLAQSLETTITVNVRESVIELAEWLDEFERHLPK